MSFWSDLARGIFWLPAGATSAATSAASAAVKYLGPKPPNYGDISGGAFGGKDSPNNRLTAQSNQARAYQAIPDVYGLRRVWPDLIQPSLVEYIDHVKFVTEWLCVSRGKGTLSEIQFADTPLLNVAGASYSVFEPSTPPGGLPENGTTTLTDVYESFASEEVNGQELPPAPGHAAVLKSGTVSHLAGSGVFTLVVPDGTDMDQLRADGIDTFIRVTTTPPSIFFEGQVQSIATAAGNVTLVVHGMPLAVTLSSVAAAFTIENFGAVTGPFTLPIESDSVWFNMIYLRGLNGVVSYVAQYYRIDANGDEITGTRYTNGHADLAATLDQRFFTQKGPLPSVGRWRAVFVRITTALGDGSGVGKVESVSAIRYYATKTLPGVTVLRVTTQATEDAIGFRDRKFNARWLRHVVGLGGSASISPSRNFARAMAHIWRLAGRSIDGLDVGKLAAINAQHGEESPLLRFDGSIDDADISLGERLQFVADTARCTVWRDGTKWTVTRDERRTAVELQCDYRNLAGRGDSVMTYAGHLPDSFDGVELEYVDEATNARKAFVRLNISSGAPVAGGASNPKRITMLGCATAEQAENRAHLEARRMLYQRSFVSDTALDDAASVGLGALVRWVDPNNFGGDDLQAGEVLTIAGATITTSEAVDFRGEASGRIQFTSQTGALLGPPVECFPAPDGAVELASVPSGLFVAGPGVQCGARYAFAVGLTADELAAAGLYVLVDATPQSDQTVQVSLASYSARLYEMDP